MPDLQPARALLQPTTTALPDEQLIPLQSLPKAPKYPPSTDHNAFPIAITLSIVEPSSLVIKQNPRSGGQRANIDRTPTIICSIQTTIFISPSHTADEIRDQLATHAQSSFGLSVTERWRWGCTITVKCDDMDDVLNDNNWAFLVSASSQGGWAWYFYLVELERSNRGVWESRSFVRNI